MPNASRYPTDAAGGRPRTAGATAALPSLEAGGSETALTFPATWKSQHGETTYDEEGKFTLRVPSEKVVAVSQEILTAGPVADITIEDIPLEDIISKLLNSKS